MAAAANVVDREPKVGAATEEEAIEGTVVCRHRLLHDEFIRVPEADEVLGAEGGGSKEGGGGVQWVVQEYAPGGRRAVEASIGDWRKEVAQGNKGGGVPDPRGGHQILVRPGGSPPEHRTKDTANPATTIPVPNSTIPNAPKHPKQDTPTPGAQSTTPKNPTNIPPPHLSP